MPVFAYAALAGQRFVFPAMLVTFTANRLSQAIVMRFRPLGFYEDGTPIDGDPAYGYYSILTPAGGHECPIIVVAASVRANAPAVPRRFMVQNLATQPPTSLAQAVDSGLDVEAPIPTASGSLTWSVETDPAQPLWGVKLQPLTTSHPMYLKMRQDLVACCRVNGSSQGESRLAHRSAPRLYHLPPVCPRVGFGVSAAADGGHYDPLF